MQELASGAVGGCLLVELSLESIKKFVEFSRFDDGPWDNLEFSRVEATDEISILFVLDYLLEFERESRSRW